VAKEVDMGRYNIPGKVIDRLNKEVMDIVSEEYNATLRGTYIEINVPDGFDLRIMFRQSSSEWHYTGYGWLYIEAQYKNRTKMKVNFEWENKAVFGSVATKHKPINKKALLERVAKVYDMSQAISKRNRDRKEYSERKQAEFKAVFPDCEMYDTTGHVGDHNSNITARINPHGDEWMAHLNVFVKGSLEDIKAKIEELEATHE